MPVLLNTLLFQWIFLSSAISTHLDTISTAVKEANSSDGVEDGVGGVIQHVVGADWGEGLALMGGENRHSLTRDIQTKERERKKASFPWASGKA